MIKIAVTGHRPKKLGGEYDLKGPYTTHIRKHLEDVIDSLHPDLMISGMALGVDTLWALIAMERSIPLMAIIPFPSQDSVWRQESKNLYKILLNYAKSTGGVEITGTDPYEAWKMDVRNKYMVNQLTGPSDVLVAVYNGDKSGGTFNCLTYAESKNKPIIKIDPKPPSYENQSESDRGDPFEESGLWAIIRQEQEARSGGI